MNLFQPRRDKAPSRLLEGRTAMTMVINGRAAIRARIAEWQRQYRNKDYGPADLLSGCPKIRADRVRWFQIA
jgi:hypothetical protein